jgi:hypothetical protein
MSLQMLKIRIAQQNSNARIWRMAYAQGFEWNFEQFNHDHEQCEYWQISSRLNWDLRLSYCWIVILGYDTILTILVNIMYQCFLKIVASSSGWNSDFNCTKMAHNVGDRKLGSDLWVNQWESVVICSASSSLPTSSNTFLCKAHFYILDILVTKEIHSLCELQCYLVAKNVPTHSKPALCWPYGNFKKIYDIIEFTCFLIALNYTY